MHLLNPSLTNPRSNDADLAAWLLLAHCTALKNAQLLKLLQLFGSPLRILEALRDLPTKAPSQPLGLSATSLEAVLNPNVRLLAWVDAAMHWQSLSGNAIVTLDDPNYPQTLLDVGSPPPLLYATGRVELLKLDAIGIIGSRQCTAAGIGNAAAFANTLGRAGLCIVSGMAAGIDAAAHQGALDAQSATIGVLGTGIDINYPKANARLFLQMREQGCLISEHPLNTPPLREHFPRRNRLIAGLGLGVLVVEAAKQSGSLITAKQAINANRDVFAIPGSIHSPVSKGCHQLIREGAKLVESADDILEEIRFTPVHLCASSNTPDNTQTLVCAAPATARDTDSLWYQWLGFDPISPDDLSARSGIQLDEWLVVLGDLEANGGIVRHLDGRVMRCN